MDELERFLDRVWRDEHPRMGDDPMESAQDEIGEGECGVAVYSFLRPTGALVREQDSQPFLHHFAEGVVSPCGDLPGLAHEMIVDAKSCSHQENNAPEASRFQSVIT